jgi:monooxygenase
MLSTATVYSRSNAVVLGYRKEGAGDPVVLLHGLGASSTAWHYQASRLAERHTVFSIDLPGFGSSAYRPRLSGEAVADMVADFLARVVGGPAALAGHSMGGAVALMVALRHPHLVTSLALVSSAGLGRELPALLRLMCLPGGSAVVSCVGPVLVRSLKRSRRLRKRFAGDGCGDVMAPVLAEAFARYQSPSAIRDFVASLRVGATVRGQRPACVMLDHLDALGVPLLVVWGRSDRVLPLRHALDAMARAGVKARLAILECGHSPMLEAAPALTDLLADFLRGHLAATVEAQPVVA